MKFLDALADGKKSEKIVLKIIKEKYDTAFIRDGYSKEYDIAIPEIDKTIEVKKDFKSQITGNIVIETYMNNQPSGITTTEADYWVIHPHPRFIYWIKPKDIKDMILIEGFKQVEFIGEGDTKFKRAYLIPEDYVELYSQKKQNISKYL